MQKVVFLNTAWMDFYDGKEKKVLQGGGSYIKEHGYGYEIYNFREINGKVYGYAQPSGNNNHIERLGASCEADRISGVLVVFTARHELGGTYIVGWYRNATFYREYQESRLKKRQYKNEYFGYYAEAAAEDAVLLSTDERLAIEVPRSKGGMGRSNVWYADSECMENFVGKVINFINGYSGSCQKRLKNGLNRTQDAKKKKEVERIAVNHTSDYYRELGYKVISVESENVGWDLTAENSGGKLRLKIEVKGLSGTDIMVELSPNEYEKMQCNKSDYRLCVVTDCLVAPLLHIFLYSQDYGYWINQFGDKLEIHEIVSARCGL